MYQLEIISINTDQINTFKASFWDILQNYGIVYTLHPHTPCRNVSTLGNGYHSGVGYCVPKLSIRMNFYSMTKWNHHCNKMLNNENYVDGAVHLYPDE